MSLDQSPSREFGFGKTGTVSNGPLLLVISPHSLSVWTNIQFYRTDSVLPRLPRWPVIELCTETQSTHHAFHPQQPLQRLITRNMGNYHDNLWMGHALLEKSASSVSRTCQKSNRQLCCKMVWLKRRTFKDLNCVFKNRNYKLFLIIRLTPTSL